MDLTRSQIVHSPNQGWETPLEDRREIPDLNSQCLSELHLISDSRFLSLLFQLKLTIFLCGWRCLLTRFLFACGLNVFLKAF